MFSLSKSHALLSRAAGEGELQSVYNAVTSPDLCPHLRHFLLPTTDVFQELTNTWNSFPSFRFKWMGLTWCSWSCGHLDDGSGMGSDEVVAAQLHPQNTIVINFSDSRFISL